MNIPNNKFGEEFDTSLPGVIVQKCEADRLIDALLKKFRKTDPSVIPSNVPTACVLEGEKDRHYLENAVFKDRKRIFVYIEGVQLVHSATPEEVLNYLAARQPWEDYDLCLFDESMGWCVGITHNNDVIVAR